MGVTIADEDVDDQSPDEFRDHVVAVEQGRGGAAGVGPRFALRKNSSFAVSSRGTGMSSTSSAWASFKSVDGVTSPPRSKVDTCRC